MKIKKVTNSIKITTILDNEIKIFVDKIINFATQEKRVKKIFLYGSRIHGSFNKESDLDVAFEIIKDVNDSSVLATWIKMKEKWLNNISKFCSHRIHLEHFNPEKSIRVKAGIKAGSILIWEKNSE